MSLIKTIKLTPEISIYLKKVCENANLTYYPLIGDADAEAPYVVYQRLSQELDNSKDGEFGMNASFIVKFVAATYSESLEMLKQFAENLFVEDGIETVEEDDTTTEAPFEEFTVVDVSITDNGEEWSENYFINTITVNITYNLK